MIEGNHKQEVAHQAMRSETSQINGESNNTSDSPDLAGGSRKHSRSNGPPIHSSCVVGEQRVNNSQSMENMINSNESGSDRVNNVSSYHASPLQMSEGIGDGSHVPLTNTAQQGLGDSNNCVQVTRTSTVSVQSTSDSAQIQNASDSARLQNDEKVPVQETAPNPKVVSVGSNNNNGADSQQKLPQSMDRNDANNSANTVPYGIQETKPSSAVTDACSKSDDKSLNCDRSKSDINSLKSDRSLDSFMKKVPVWGISVGVLGIAIVAGVFLSRK